MKSEQDFGSNSRQRMGPTSIDSAISAAHVVVLYVISSCAMTKFKDFAYYREWVLATWRKVRPKEDRHVDRYFI